MAKFLSKSNLTYLWGKIKTLVATKQDVLVSGTSIKTINGESVLGSGDITLDLSLYKVVTALPTTDIDANKIYLVKSSEEGTNNVYIEYMYVNSAWEKMGEYKSDVDLTDYAKTADVDASLALKADKSDTYTKSEVDAKVTASGTFSDADAVKLAGIETGAQVNVIEEVKVDGTVLTVTDKAVNIDLSGKQDKLTAGENISIADDGTISATDTTYEEATTSAAGLLSAADKTKLDAVAEGATADEALTEAEIDEAIAAAG